MNTETVQVQCRCVEGAYITECVYDDPCHLCRSARRGTSAADNHRCKLCFGGGEIAVEIQEGLTDDARADAIIIAQDHEERRVGYRKPETGEEKIQAGRMSAINGYRDPVLTGDVDYEQGRMLGMADACAQATVDLVHAAKGGAQ